MAGSILSTGSVFSIEPHVPKDISGASGIVSKLDKGVEIRLGKSPMHKSFGIEDLTEPAGKESFASLWMLAHLLLKAYQAEGLPSRMANVTSSAYEIDSRTIRIVHNAVSARKKEASFLSPLWEISPDKGHYGVEICLPLTSFPRKDIDLEQLVTDYPEAASALTLMNADQLKTLLLIGGGKVVKGKLWPYISQQGLFTISLWGSVNMRMVHLAEGYQTRTVSVLEKNEKENRIVRPNDLTEEEMWLANRLSYTLNHVGYEFGRPVFRGPSQIAIPMLDKDLDDLSDVVDDFKGELEKKMPEISLVVKKGKKGTASLNFFVDSYATTKVQETTLKAIVAYKKLVGQ